MTGIEELKRLAQKATPGPWHVSGYAPEEIRSSNSIVRAVARRAGPEDTWDVARRDAAYIAAANPQAILSLIERLEALEAERKGIVKLTLEQARAIETMPGVASTTMQTTCPVCGERRWRHPAEKMRHAPDCWLAAAIKEAQGE